MRICELIFNFIILFNAHLTYTQKHSTIDPKIIYAYEVNYSYYVF